MESIATLNSKLDQLAAQIAAKNNVPPTVATQADLDALGAKLDADIAATAAPAPAAPAA